MMGFMDSVMGALIPCNTMECVLRETVNAQVSQTHGSPTLLRRGADFFLTLRAQNATHNNRTAKKWTRYTTATSS